MQTVAVFALALAAANAGLLAHSVLAPVVTGAALQGPSTRTTLVGPDGSHIVAAAPGGRIDTAVDAGIAVVSHSGPVVAAPAVLAARYQTFHAGVPTVYAAGYNALPSVIGSPYLAKTIVASPLTASGYPLLAPGSGLEGQYVPDYTEKLYDDGSYKGEFYH